jgi:hypothetical protein
MTLHHPARPAHCHYVEYTRTVWNEDGTSTLRGVSLKCQTLADAVDVATAVAVLPLVGAVRILDVCANVVARFDADGRIVTRAPSGLARS